MCEAQWAKTTGTARTSRLSPRNGLRLIRALPGEAAFLAPVAGGTYRRRSARVAAPGPHDFAVRCGCFARHAISAPATAASTASRAHTYCDDRDTPLHRARG